MIQMEDPMEQGSENKNNGPLRSESLGMLIKSLRDGSFREMYADWKWIMRYAGPYKSRIALYTLLGLLCSATGLASSVAGKYVIDIITGYDSSRLWLVAVLMIAGAALSIGFSSLSSWVSARLGVDINNDIQADVFGRLLDSEWLELSRFKSGDILNRFTSDVGTVASNAICWIPNLVIYLFSFAATFCVIMYYDPIMALIAFASAPVLLFTSRPLMRKMRGYSRRTRETLSELSAFQVEVFYNVDSIKSFDAEDDTKHRLKDWQDRYKDVALGYNSFSIRTKAWLAVLGKLVEFIAFGYCLWRLWGHYINYGTMTLFLQQRAGLSSAFSGLVGMLPAAMTSSVAARRIRELAELPKEPRGETPEHDGAYALELKNIDFSYTQGVKVISDSGFSAAPGEIVALVGTSGEGKTTLIRLLLGLIHPDSGTARLTGPDGEIPISADTRRLFSYVPQGNTVFSGTIADNLRIVRQDADDGQIIAALKAACAWDFVAKMPEGINSSVGERGRGLSEGQAQRIAIARAILRDAPILLMDEATSALDVATERQVLRSILEHCPDKTCVITTHRPSVLNMCSRVYRVLDTCVTELSEEESAKMVMEF